MSELGKLAKLREQQVLEILADESPLHFPEIDARRISSGHLTTILEDLNYYGLIQLANFEGITIQAIANITDDGRKLLADLTDSE